MPADIADVCPMPKTPETPTPSASFLSAAGDRHFDGLADKFAASLYGGVRGELRLALLDQLLPEMLELHGQPLLDVGGGLGRYLLYTLVRPATSPETRPPLPDTDKESQA